MLYEKNYKTYLGDDCLGACIMNYLKYADIEIEQYEIFLIGEGFLLKFDNIMGVITTNKKYGDIYRESMGKLGLDFLYADCCGFEREFLIDAIKGEKAITVEVKSKLLTYDNIFINGEDSKHCINVIGYSAHNDTVYISDGFVPKSSSEIFEGWINLEDLLIAWKANGSKYYIFEFTACIGNTEKYLNYYVRKSIYEYLCDEVKCLYIGKSAVSQLGEYIISAFSDKVDDNKKISMFLNYEICFLGFLQSKRALAKYIRNALLDEELSAKYEMCVKKWEIFRIKIYKYAYMPANGDLASLKKLLDNISNEECAVLKTVLNRLGI